MPGAGKGDDYRYVDYKKWCENYDRIFQNSPDSEVDKKKSAGPSLEKEFKVLYSNKQEEKEPG